MLIYALKEAAQSLNTHRSRTFSMGFGIWWAIFILVLILGVGNGFHRGVSNAFAKYGTKTMVIWGGSTAGRHHPIPTTMVGNFAKAFPAIQQISPMLRYNSDVTYAAQKVNARTLGCDPSYALLTHLPIQEGRFFTIRDAATVNNICVIGINIKEKLFGATSAIGKYIFLGDMGLQVVGVLDAFRGMYGESNALLVTNSLFKKILPEYSDNVESIRLTLVPTAREEIVESQFRSYFARHLHFDVQNTKGLGLFSLTKHANKFHNFFKNLATFNAIIGICLLLTGMVGISNMMLVTVQERTQELAIRRVLGSRSIEIVLMILCETIMVTFVAGMVGFTASFLLMQLLNQWLVPLCQTYYLSTLRCSPESIFIGLGLIALSSSLAAIVPAIRAVKIKPVEALNRK
ncbi:ABC transporter permease [Candidatus Cardinium hertigii]|uniref:ABC transporter permease n=1 Tax=Candidatus Cardinium hertigii TaxID=247481 RepID=UPI003D7EED57